MVPLGLCEWMVARAFVDFASLLARSGYSTKINSNQPIIILITQQKPIRLHIKSTKKVISKPDSLVAGSVKSFFVKARDRLLSKVKADQERLKQLDARAAETTEEVVRMKERLEDLESDLKADRKGDVAQNKVM